MVAFAVLMRDEAVDMVVLIPLELVLMPKELVLMRAE
jgi:hypothetical protein